ncbi:MAG TPA: YbaK/EbsC family protein [Candidatus Nitrosotalea sp.]|jgi:Ala-tRNA(Pro) deacylase|nr:YbaK/EbsC family protein [Candidatus Nitrosotalea sp.]
MNERLEELLGVRGVRYERVTHREAFTSQEEAAHAHVSGWSWAKTLVVKDPVGLALAVLPACCRADLNRLKGLIGRGEVRLATVEEMLAAFPGCEVGAVPPFGRIFGVPTIVEEALLEQREITLPTGDHRTAIRMLAHDYVSLAEARPGRFAVHESQFPVHPPLRTGAVGTGH